MEQLDEQTKLRKYILNDISEDERAAIEERLLTENEFFEELAMAEENLIQDYADGKLAANDRARFEQYFLCSEKNRQKVKFARALRKHVNDSKDLPAAKKNPGFFESLKAFFSAPVAAGLTMLVVAGIIGFFLWKNYAGRSEVLIALNKAYQSERPVESRISDFDYAPLRNIRGNESEKVDKNQLELAKMTALRAATDNPSAENLHALGRVYLAETNFPAAIEQLEKAARLAPDNAKLHNDLGVAYLESEKSKTERNFEDVAKANEEFGRAIKLDASLREAHNLRLPPLFKFRRARR